MHDYFLLVFFQFVNQVRKLDYLNSITEQKYMSFMFDKTNRILKGIIYFSLKVR